MRNYNNIDPSLNHSIGYDYGTSPNKITILYNHYLKNIRHELLEEEVTNHHQCTHYIVYVTAKINEVTATLMIDTGANVSLMDSTELNRIQEESRAIIPTLPVTNIILIGATGRQNKSVKKQVRLEAVSYTHLDVYKRQVKYFTTQYQYFKYKNK